MNGQHGVNAVPAVERAKSIARGYATNPSVQLTTEDAKETTKSMLTVMLAAVQVSRPAVQASTCNNKGIILTNLFHLQRMVIGLHGPAGVTAQCLAVMDNREDKEHVIKQNVEEKVAMAASTVPRPAILHATINVRALSDK